MFGQTRDDFLEALRALLAQPDVGTVSKGLQVGFIEGVLSNHSYRGMSHEELVIRFHFNFPRYSDLPVLKCYGVDTFLLENYFLRLGISSCSLILAIKKCVEISLLTSGTVTDGQADFRTTIWRDATVSLKDGIAKLKESQKNTKFE